MDLEYDYFENRPVDVAQEHRRRVAFQVNVRIDMRNLNDLFAVSLPLFRKRFRMPQHLAFELCRRLRPYLPASVPHRRYIPLEIKVLCALAFYGEGSYQDAVGALSMINISRASVCNAIADITEALNQDEIIARFIRFPADRRQREFTIARNERLGLPRVLGYIDETLIKITPPPRDMDAEVYFCRKNYCALNVQIVCDSDLYIMDINSRFPGSANDPYVYQQSGVREAMREAYQESRCWLLGDSIYPLEPWLQTPMPNAEIGSPEYEYTQVHCQNRNPVERCNGVLKGRWRCCLWDRTLHYFPEKADEVAPNNPDDDDDPDDPDDFAGGRGLEGDNSSEDDVELAQDDRRQWRQLALAERQYLIEEVQARRRRLAGGRRHAD